MKELQGRKDGWIILTFLGGWAAEFVLADLEEVKLGLQPYQPVLAEAAPAHLLWGSGGLASRIHPAHPATSSWVQEGAFLTIFKSNSACFCPGKESEIKS